ncbi:MAG: substrate-binding periplasmic protein [Elstera sp.]
MGLKDGLFAGAALFFFALSSTAQATEIRLIAPHLPPFASADEGEPKGFMVETLLAVARAVGHSGKVSIVPIPRMLQEMAVGTRMISSFTARIPEREGKFAWLDPGVEEVLSFATLSGQAGLTLETARNLKTIGTIMNGVPENFLRRHGFDNFDSATTEDASLRKLLVGRIDAWFTSRWVIPVVMARENVPPDRIILSDPITRYPLNFAATLDIPEEELAPWRRALADFRASGGVDRLIATYRP